MKKVINLNEDISFDREVDVLNQCFGKNYGGFQRGSCRVGKHENMIVWFPKMAVYRNGHYQAPKKGDHDWINVMSEDGRFIRMYTDDNHLKNDNNWDLIHFAFGKSRDGKFRYIGTFVKRKTEKFPYEARFERIATSIDLSNWDAEIVLADDEKKKEKQLRSMSIEQLLKAALDHESQEPEVIESKPTTTRKRSPEVSEFTKARAKGFCELCGQEAPFKNKNGEPYLETHHIIPLADKGSDTIENTVALCPNCHRRMHQLKDPKDIKKLQQIHKCVIQ